MPWELVIRLRSGSLVGIGISHFIEMHSECRGVFGGGGEIRGKYLTCFYQNIRELRKDFSLQILSNKYDIVFITETRLNQDIYSAEMFDTLYITHRIDREPKFSGKNGGGGGGGKVLIAVKTNLDVERIQLFNVTNFYFEYVWLKINVPYKKVPYKQVSSTFH